MTRIVEDVNKKFYCPLLKKDIYMGYCYDINMVVFGFIKPSFIDNVVDREMGRPVCEKCENLQF